MVAVGTWNLENLFLPDSEFGPDTQQAYEEKLAALTGHDFTLARAPTGDDD